MIRQVRLALVLVYGGLVGASKGHSRRPTANPLPLSESMLPSVDRCCRAGPRLSQR